MTSRAEAAAETRQRIVEATAAVHASKGIASTTYRDIAEAADIAIGTIYHHFPTYLDVIEACGAHTMATSGLPDRQIFDGTTRSDDRIAALVTALFEFYERNQWIARIRAEGDQFETVRLHFAALDDHVRELIRQALSPTKPSKTLLATLLAILDFIVWERLRENGLSTAEAIEEIRTVVVRHVDKTKPGATRRKKTGKGTKR